MIEIKRNKKELRIILILIIVLLLLGALSYIYQIDWRGDYDSLNNTKTQKVVLTEDSDKDGLLDWEEELRGTDPNKKDTDDDGTEDGEEVKLNRNPLIKAPGDELQNISQKETGHGLISERPTEDLAKEIFYKYILLKQENEDVTELEKQEIVEKFNEKINENSFVRGKKYFSSDLKVIKDYSTDDIVNYRDMFGKKLNIMNDVYKNELSVYKNAVKNQDVVGFKKLEDFAGVYQKTIEGLLLIQIPQNATPFHLNVINSLSQFSASIIDMSKTKTDPIKIIAAINNFLKTEEVLTESFKNINTYFNNNI